MLVGRSLNSMESTTSRDPMQWLRPGPSSARHGSCLNLPASSAGVVMAKAVALMTFQARPRPWVTNCRILCPLAAAGEEAILKVGVGQAYSGSKLAP